MRLCRHPFFLLLFIYLFLALAQIDALFKSAINKQVRYNSNTLYSITVLILARQARHRVTHAHRQLIRQFIKEVKVVIGEEPGQVIIDRSFSPHGFMKLLMWIF